jgi:hypothetical protein
MPFQLRKTILLTLCAAVGSGLAACSDTPTSSVSRGSKMAVLDKNTSSMNGMNMESGFREGALYVAELHSLNAGVQNKLDPDRKTPRGVATGKAYFRVVNGMLTAVVDMAGTEPADGSFPEGIHPQHIHAADRCPTAAADVNGDGIVDVIEGLPFYGPILVPLDGDISNTTSEIPTFPFGMGDRGTYHYEASTVLHELEASIGAALNLPTRHVVVHGVDLATPLPASVQSLPGLPAQVTLPIACGEIREVQAQ